jgi:hypothetical protein
MVLHHSVVAVHHDPRRKLESHLSQVASARMASISWQISRNHMGMWLRYCDAYTDTHPYIYASHVHAPNQFHTYTDTHSYILHAVFHAGARDFVSNVQCICNPFRAAPIYQTANARQAFTSEMVCLSAWHALPEPEAQLVAPVRTPASSVKQDITRRQLNSTSVASSAQTRVIAPRVALVYNTVHVFRVSVSPQTATADVLLHQATFANQK